MPAWQTNLEKPLGGRALELCRRYMNNGAEPENELAATAKLFAQVRILEPKAQVQPPKWHSPKVNAWRFAPFLPTRFATLPSPLALIAS